MKRCQHKLEGGINCAETLTDIRKFILINDRNLSVIRNNQLKEKNSLKNVNFTIRSFGFKKPKKNSKIINYEELVHNERNVLKRKMTTSLLERILKLGNKQTNMENSVPFQEKDKKITEIDSFDEEMVEMLVNKKGVTLNNYVTVFNADNRDSMHINPRFLSSQLNLDTATKLNIGVNYVDLNEIKKLQKLNKLLTSTESLEFTGMRKQFLSIVNPKNELHTSDRLSQIRSLIDDSILKDFSDSSTESSTTEEEDLTTVSFSIFQSYDEKITKLSLSYTNHLLCIGRNEKHRNYSGNYCTIQSLPFEKNFCYGGIDGITKYADEFLSNHTKMLIGRESQLALSHMFNLKKLLSVSKTIVNEETEEEIKNNNIKDDLVVNIFAMELKKKLSSLSFKKIL